MVGATGLILVYLLVILAPWIAPYGYSKLDLSINDPGPSLAHPMGTQLLGQDELTRVLYGGRVTLLLALAVAALTTPVGTAVGLVSGYYGRTTDTSLMSLSDFTLALPLIPLSLVAGFTFGFSPLTLILILSLLLWPRMARLVRAEVLSVRNQEYVEASRALGVGEVGIMVRHLLPNVAGVVVVEATLTLAAAILAESALSFVAAFMCDANGCFMDPGIKTGAQSLGMMLGKSITTMDTQWWLTVFPGAVIALTVLFVGFLGDGLRDVLDPRTRG